MKLSELEFLNKQNVHERNLNILGHQTTLFNAPLSKGNRHSKSSRNSKLDQKSRIKNRNRNRRMVSSHPMTEEEDSLHATTTDLGGTTIPAEATP